MAPWHGSWRGGATLALGAFAIAADNDSDGYHDSGLDCDDSDASINPAMPEDLSTAYDDNCDGIDQIVQLLEAPLSTGVWWTVTNVTWPENVALLSPTVGNDATMELDTGFDWDWGELHVQVGVEAIDSGAATCTVTIDAGAAGTATDTFSTAGEHDLSFPSLDPPYTVDSLELSCTRDVGTPGVRLDYLNVLNGSYAWPHPRDQEIAWIDADFNMGGNAPSVVRTDATGSYLVAAANNSGVVVSTDGDGDHWYLKNGIVDGKKLDTQAELAVYEVYALSDDDIVALSGREFGSSMFGGLFRTEDGGDSWDPLGVDGKGEDNLHVCKDKALAGGKLLTGWNDGETDVLFYANHDTDVGAGKHVGAYDLTDDQACGVAWVDTANRPSGGIVSSLEVTEIGDNDYLLIGYKSLDVDDNGPALWACKLEGKCDGTPTALLSTCEGIAGTEAWDIRDIAIQDDGSRTLVYVADAGVRYDSTASPTTCSRVEGTVQVVALTESGGGISESLWDSDTGLPAGCSGDCDTGDTCGCPQGWHDTGEDTAMPQTYRKYYDKDYSKDLGEGELRIYETPYDSRNELTGVALWEEGTDAYLFAVAMLSSAYAFPRIHRADVSTAPSTGTTLNWKPLQDYYTGESEVRDQVTGIDTNPEERAFAGNDKDGYLRGLSDYDERDLVFPRSPVDITFYLLDDNDTWEGQVYGFHGVYELPEENGSTPGFDSVYGDADGMDLDDIPIAHAPHATTGDFQQTTVRSIAYCDGCDPDGAGVGIDAVGLAFGGVGDHGIGTYYGPPDTAATREPAVMECHYDSFSAESREVALVEDENGATLWGLLYHDTAQSPTNRALLKADIDFEDDYDELGVCYETSQAAKDDNSTAFNNDQDLVCDRHQVESSYPEWPGCDESEGANQGELLDNLSSGFELGNPYALDVLEDNHDVALVSFYSYGQGDTADPGYREAGLVLFYDDAGDMQRYMVPFDMPTGCSYDEWELFEGAVDVAIDQTSSSWTSETEFELYAYVAATGVTSDACSVFQVVIDYDSGIDALWTALPIGGTTECDGLTYDRVQGVATAPWAPHRAFVYGVAQGEDALCEIDAETPSSPVLSPMAPIGTKWRRVKYVAPHPHLAETLFVGVTVQYIDTGET